MHIFVQRKPEENKSTGPENLMQRAVWRQPQGFKHPNMIGKARDLGLHGNHTVLLWVKRATEERKGNYIICGDNNTRDITDKVWNVRIENEELVFGFGANNWITKFTSINWIHVAFVYDTNGGMSILTNGYPADKKSECGGNRPYIGDETIYLGHKKRENTSNAFEIFQG